MKHVRNMELNPVEKNLKMLYQRYSARHLNQPCAREDVRDILDAAFSTKEPPGVINLNTNIDEQAFISDDMDAAFVRHLRYIPAFWHAHRFFELLYVVNGKCINTVFNQTISMCAGDICIMAPDIDHAISAFSDEDIVLNILIRKSTFEQSFFGLLEGDDILSDFFKRTFYQTVEIPYLIFHTGDDPQIYQDIDRAYQEYIGKRRYKKQMINVLLSELFISLFRRHEQNIEIANVRLNTAEQNLIYILRYMQAHYTSITLKELAEFFNYSERQLQRLILNATGMTFKENIQKQKMTKAAGLLTYSNLSVSQICERTGFQSFNNFRKIFYKYYQMTPSEFRKACSAEKRESAISDGEG